MLRFGARLTRVGCGTFKKSLFHTNFPSVGTVAQFATLNNVKSLEGPTSQVVAIASSLQDLGFDENEIIKAIQTQPDLLKKPSSVWKSVLGSLQSFGFKKDDVLSILNEWPDILSLKKSILDTNLDAWFRCNLGTDLTLEVLKTHPYLLQVHHLSVQKRVKQYQTFLESKKRVGKLLIIAPNTLTEGWDELLDKLNYLDELCTDKSDLVSSGVLAHSAYHIRARHEFLIRAGLYKRPGKEYNKRLCKNPKLSIIVNSSDKELCKMAGLSVLEYEVFLEMFEKEYKELKNQEIDSDDEEESRLSYFKHSRPPKK